MFAVTVTLTIKPGEMPAFLPLMMENARASLGEPACNRFDVCTEPERSDEVFLYELYDDEAGFAAHRETPHYRRFSDATDALIADKRVVTWSRVEG